jgi:hypothetical protein
MKKLIFAILLTASAAFSPVLSPVLAQTSLVPKSAVTRVDTRSAVTRVDTKSAATRVDNCAPIGRTEDGKLVYSMKCETLPTPPAPPPQAEVAPAPPPEPEVQRSGIFGWSYERKRE